MKRFVCQPLFLSTILIVSTGTYAADELRVCVFDLMGAGGDAYAMMRDYALFAQKEGVPLKLAPYLDERIAAEDFKAGKCDMAGLTGLRGRQFNSFTGSIEAIGAVITPNTAKALMELVANPKLADDMINKQYEIAGVSSLGSAFLLTNDRAISTLGKIAGKRMGVLDYDKAQRKMAEKIGAQPVAIEISSMASKFNTGQIDVLGVPAMAIKPLELYKGMGSKGAIARFPVLTLTTNVVIRKDKFPEGFGQKSRTWFASQSNRAMQATQKIENDIPAKYWMDIPADDQVSYMRIMRDARIGLTKEGIYNAKMMRIIKKIRCKQSPSSFECPLTDE